MNLKSSNIRKILISTSVILLIIIILFTPLAYSIFNLNYYESLYENNGVFLILNREDVKSITLKVFDFFKYKSDLDNSDYSNQVRYSDESISAAAVFGSDEISHLKDVRALLAKIFILYLAGIFLFIISAFIMIKKDTANFVKNLGIILIISSASVLAFIAIFFMLGKNFPVLFDDFHLVFFPQGNYSFLQSSLIITLFPYGFFYDFFIRIIRDLIIISAVLLILGLNAVFIFRYRKRKFNKIKTI